MEGESPPPGPPYLLLRAGPSEEGDSPLTLLRAPLGHVDVWSTLFVLNQRPLAALSEARPPEPKSCIS